MQHALKFILKLLKGGEEEDVVDDFVKPHPKLRLQAWFEDHSNQGYSHWHAAGLTQYIDIDPSSWNEVARLADRIVVAY